MRNIDNEIQKLIQIRAEVNYIQHLRAKYTDYVFVSHITYMQLPPNVINSGLTFYIVPMSTLEYLQEDRVYLDEFGEVVVIKP